MTRYAIGDLQGCDRELRELLARLKFSADRDQLWFVGDLVNRGPGSLAALRLVHALGGNAVCVLGNHDLHLLAVAYGAHKRRKSDTLDEVLAAPDREPLLQWLLSLPLLHRQGRDLMVHAGLIPQWSADFAARLATEVSAALQHDPPAVLGSMYGNEPDRWDAALAGMQRLRFAINVFTRMRVCTVDGRLDLTIKGAPAAAPSPLRPWFEHPQRASRDQRVIFGHWSALGLVRRAGILGLDSGCVWGGSLTAANLDAADEAPVIAVACKAYRNVDGE
ncbi:MAG: symmetrical bis(5'-nucleosyl)-tetraphosphatase [Proteobacteria bacterium]|nr:symmetrical bis(5'-nucleosyl)-tetraphosphatase [Pseudomonadota bacterium]